MDWPLYGNILRHERVNRYLLQYKRDRGGNSPDDYNENVKKEFNRFLNASEQGEKGYTVSFYRDTINAKLGVNKLSNKQVKQLLTEFYSRDICFTYPKDKSKPPMFLKTI